MKYLDAFWVFLGGHEEEENDLKFKSFSLVSLEVNHGAMPRIHETF